MDTKTRFGKTQKLIVFAFMLFMLEAVQRLFLREYYLIFISLGAAALMFIPFLARKLFNITVPKDMQIAFVLFVAASMILGKVYNLYEIIPVWDKLLHIFSGVMLCVAGARLAKCATGFLFGLFAFCFSLAAGAVWEIYEYAVDTLFGLDSQIAASGINDTMLDLICDAGGALLYLLYLRIKALTNNSSDT